MESELQELNKRLERLNKEYKRMELSIDKIQSMMLQNLDKETAEKWLKIHRLEETEKEKTANKIFRNFKRNLLQRYKATTK